MKGRRNSRVVDGMFPRTTISLNGPKWTSAIEEKHMSRGLRLNGSILSGYSFRLGLPFHIKFRKYPNVKKLSIVWTVCYRPHPKDDWRLCFHRCVCLFNFWRGVPPSGQTGGTPSGQLRVPPSSKPGGLPPSSQGGGVPSSSQLEGGTPIQPTGDYPSLPEGGVSQGTPHPSRVDWGTPCQEWMGVPSVLTWDRGTLVSQDWMGTTPTPHVDLGWGTPTPPHPELGPGQGGTPTGTA